jgi:hypothetical protein
MSEPEKKMFMLCCDELSCAFLHKVMPSLNFVEIRAMDLTGNTEVRAIVSPIAPIPEAPKEEPKPDA